MTISSVSGREIDFAAGPYGAFKAALVHYTQGLAYQLAGKGIRANSVSPGNTYFEGGVWDQIEDGNPELYATPWRSASTGRMGTPQEMANATVFLASPRRKLHHRRQPRRRWRADQRSAVLTGHRPTELVIWVSVILTCT